MLAIEDGSEDSFLPKTTQALFNPNPLLMTVIICSHYVQPKIIQYFSRFWLLFEACISISIEKPLILGLIFCCNNKSNSVTRIPYGQLKKLLFLMIDSPASSKLRHYC